MRKSEALAIASHALKNSLTNQDRAYWRNEIRKLYPK